MGSSSLGSTSAGSGLSAATYRVMKALPYFSPATNLSGAVAAKALWEDTNPTVVGSESGTLAPAQRRQGISLQMHVNNVLRYLVLLSEAQASVLIAGSRLCAELPRFRQELRVLMAEHIFSDLSVSNRTPLALDPEFATGLDAPFRLEFLSGNNGKIFQRAAEMLDDPRLGLSGEAT